MNDAIKNLMKFGGIAANLIGQVREVVASPSNSFTKQDEAKLADLCEKDRDFFDKIISTAKSNSEANRGIDIKVTQLLEEQKRDAEKIEGLYAILGDFAKVLVEMNEKLEKVCHDACRDQDDCKDELDHIIDEANKKKK